MMRQTGGCAVGAISTRSRSRLRANANASRVAITPRWFPSLSIRRTVSTRIRSLTRWSPGTVAITLSLLFVTPHWRHHGKRVAKLLGTRRTSVARWTLALPTSLAELPNNFSRPGRAVRFEVAAHARRYVVSVSDQNEQPIDETEEIAYLRSTPVETVLGNHFFVL